MRVVVIALLLVTACGEAATSPDPTPSASASAGSTVTAVLTGAPVVRDDGTVMWCPNASVEGCAGIPVTGLTSEWRDALDDPGRIWAVEGAYDGEQLAASGPPEPVAPTRSESFATPCSDLRGEHDGTGNPDPAAAEAIARYVETIPDRYAGQWWDSDTGVMTVLLTGEDVAGHQAALGDAVGARGTVCVAGGAHYTAAELDAVQRRAIEIAADAGLGPWSAGTDTVGNRVDLEVERIDEPARERIRQQAGDAVRVRAFLALRDATLAQLPEPPPKGDVALETADTRGGAGMDALGTFTIRFDARRRCVYGDAGAERVGLIWPFGYYAMSDPLRVFDNDGRLVAREGDLIESGGGGGPREGPDVCGTSNVWIMNGGPTVVGSSEAAAR
jgi:hypothetical protein